jgi:hypothetical protein
MDLLEIGSSVLDWIGLAQGNYRVAAQLVASRAVLGSTELVSLMVWYDDIEMDHLGMV